jgi:hypothetical protein
MKSNIQRIGVAFLAAFFLICAGLLAHDFFFLWPIQACEEHGNWWDDQDHICAVPVPLSTITGRRSGAHKPAAPKPGAPVVVAKPGVQSPTKR